MEKTKEEIINNLIEKHLHKFGEVSLFRASLDSFRETGKVSGSFYLALKEMMEEYSKGFYNAGLMAERIINRSLPIEQEQDATINMASTPYSELLKEREWLCNNLKSKDDKIKEQKHEIERLKDQNNMLDGDWRSAQQEIKRLRSVVDKLEAQLKEKDNAFRRIQQEVAYLSHGAALNVVGICMKALESSPIEQPKNEKQ